MQGAPERMNKLATRTESDAWLTQPRSVDVRQSDGDVLGDGLSNAQAWALVDRLDQDAIRMENTRRRIADAFSEIEL
jgi:hypothetical protein